MQKLMKREHANEEADVLLTRDPNKILKLEATDVHLDELKLSCKTKQSLAQLRTRTPPFSKVTGTDKLHRQLR